MVYQTLGGIREWRAVDQAAEDRRRRVRSQPTRWPILAAAWDSNADISAPADIPAQSPLPRLARTRLRRPRGGVRARIGPLGSGRRGLVCKAKRPLGGGRPGGVVISFDRPSSFLAALGRPELAAIAAMLDEKIDGVMRVIQKKDTVIRLDRRRRGRSSAAAGPPRTKRPSLAARFVPTSAGIRACRRRRRGPL